MTVGSANNGTITIGGGSPPRSTLGQIDHETIDSSVPIGRIHVGQDAGIALTAPSLSNLYVGGSLHDSTMTLTAGYAAGRLDLSIANIVGPMTNVVIASAGNIGSVAAQEMVNDSIDAGVGSLAAGQCFQGWEILWCRRRSVPSDCRSRCSRSRLANRSSRRIKSTRFSSDRFKPRIMARLLELRRRMS